MKLFAAWKKRVVQVSVSDKFNELSQSGQSPVCLRKACKEFNHEMLQELASEVHEIMCTDEIDQTRHKSGLKRQQSNWRSLIVTAT